MVFGWSYTRTVDDIIIGGKSYKNWDNTQETKMLKEYAKR